MRAQAENRWILSANLRKMIGSDDSEEAIAASVMVADALMIFVRMNTKR